jgi:S1-C subfamily serine protease
MTWRRVISIALAGGALAALASHGHADRVARGRETIENAMPATVMVIAIDLRGGELVPVASGSGTIISPEGAILTNHHVISDSARGKPQDLFVIARLDAPGRPLQPTCAGVPARGLLAPELDLALIQCELDLDGLPFRAEHWPSLSVGESRHISPGERLWVLGYPDTGGMALRDSFGQVLGWTSDAGGSGETYIKTDAAITHGNSGGAAIDQRGDLIGIPSAYRLRRDVSGEISVAAGSVGLIRPIHAARHLLDAAQASWRPQPAPASPDPDEPEAQDTPVTDRELDAEIAPRDPPRVRPPPRGVQLTSRVVCARSGAAISGAVVAILDAEVDPSAPDAMAHALAWAETDADGVFRFEEPVARRRAYPVVVMARGYEAAVAAPGLELPADAPQLHDPWGHIALRPSPIPHRHR